MNRFLVFLGLIFMTTLGNAKTAETIDYVPEVSLSARGGYNHDFSENTGRFCGDGLYVDINGNISPSLSYSVNQTIASRYVDDVSGFNGTNWLKLNYEIGDFCLSVGKDAMYVGSFEYDTEDIDSYYEMNSMFYNMISCWQWGAAAAYYPSDSHELMLQATNSPFSNGEGGLFAYAAAWRGYWDSYESYWSANLWQYAPGKYVKSINLGNRFYFGGFTLDLEYMTRAHEAKGLFSSDFTALAVPSYEWDWGRAFAKFSYEHVAEDLPYELAYEAGNYMLYGAGVEMYPLKDNKSLRAHAIWTADTMGMNAINIGLTWIINFK